MTPDQITALLTAAAAAVSAIAGLVAAIQSRRNHRIMQRVERAANGNLSRLAEHLEQARLELLDLRGQALAQQRQGRRRRVGAANSGRPPKERNRGGALPASPRGRFRARSPRPGSQR